ncbi:hypothetical protein VNO78_23429 [Psophocarpus tetragonolobus]|uniref:Uncharacterized protein n=1 Tax=Psophocarpus tetragonolobus TaxID=3891 RepID=A0AAN9S3P4_PSOTE
MHCACIGNWVANEVLYQARIHPLQLMLNVADFLEWSMSKSFSNSRSYSGDRHKSRSISRSQEAQGRSPSIGFVVLHDDDLFLLQCIHHDVLLLGDYLIQG